MVFVTRNSAEYWRSISEQYRLEIGIHADASAAWFKIAERRHAKIRKLIWACYGLGSAVLILGVALWLKS